MCFHTLRKDKGIQNSELVTFKPEVNSSVAQATWGEAQKSVAKGSVPWQLGLRFEGILQMILSLWYTSEG